LSRHLLRAQEEERKRISRELHDETGQGLMVLRLYLSMLAGEIRRPESQVAMQEAMNLLDRTIEELRRVIGRLSPRILEELGLAAAIRREVRELSKHAEMKPRLNIAENLGGLSPEIEAALYRSAQEARHNIGKHSKAQNFSVHLEIDRRCITLQIEDDGVGISGQRNAQRWSFGLAGLRDRVAALGGTLRIRSRRGEGTRVRVTIPLARTGSGHHPGPCSKQPPQRQHPVGLLRSRSKSGVDVTSSGRSAKPNIRYTYAH
jgi:signal transduction histidine kinase